MIRRTVLFSGRVQGVGFRFTVTEAVGDARVAGYVRNLDDGRVEAVFEGESTAIDAVLDRVRARMPGQIDGEAATDGPAIGEFTRFEMRR